MLQRIGLEAQNLEALEDPAENQDQDINNNMENNYQVYVDHN